MTKKDYKLIAAAIANLLLMDEDVKHVAWEFAYRLQMDNPRFDRGKFLAACGVD